MPKEVTDLPPPEAWRLVEIMSRLIQVFADKLEQQQIQADYSPISAKQSAVVRLHLLHDPSDAF